MIKSLEKPTFKERCATSAMLSAFFVFVYTATNYITTQRLDVGTAVFFWEKWIPFVPIFIIPYWSIDVFFVFAPFVVASHSELALFRKRMTWAIATAGIFFLLFPLRLLFQRPEVEGVLGVLFGSLDELYNFHNLAPSLHLAIRAILWTVYIPHSRGTTRQFLVLWFFLIGLSTLLCWQHHVIDVFTGQLLGLMVIHLLPESNFERGNLAARVNSDWTLACKYFSGFAFFLALVLVLPLWGIIFLWPAASLFVVTLGYAGIGPGIFRKEKGTLHTQTRKLLAPFYLGLWLSYLYFTKGKPAVTEVLPGLFVGRALRDSEFDVLSERRIAHVLDLSAEWTEPAKMRSLAYKEIPVLDLTLPSREQLEQSYVTLSKWAKLGPSYVHCSLGLGRTSVVILYYLVRSGIAEDVDKGAAILREKKADIVLSRAKLEYLRTLLTTA